MEAFREYIQTYGPQHFGLALPLNILINTIVMWFTVNWMTRKRGEDRYSWRQCLICALLLYAVSAASIYMLVFPTALIFIGAVLFWLVAPIIIILSVFELPDGGFTILFIYLFILVGVHAGIKLLI